MELALRDFVFILLIKILFFFYYDIYAGMWRYSSFEDLLKIIKASCFSSFFIAFLIYCAYGFVGFSRSVFILDCLLTILLISTSRFSIRFFYQYLWNDLDVGKNPNIWRSFRYSGCRNTRNLLIIGAGDFGEKIYREIQNNAGLKYQVVGFVDDSRDKIGKRIHGIPVFGPLEETNHIVEKLKVKELLIAIASISSRQMRRIVSYCGEIGIPFKILPGMSELIGGRINIKAIRDVNYYDLLGRELIRLEENTIGGLIENKVILVSGAGGSIGSELCRQVCRFKPSVVVLYEQAESPLYEIELELKKTFPYIKIFPMLADIRCSRQLTFVFNRFRPQVVFHAAAYKHVPMLESNPSEAVINNIIGTRNIVEVSKRFSIDRFVFISTDKAVRPVNIMGASKRAAELIIQGQPGPCQTRFMIVRFGNVIGSVGSVVPLFKKQIEAGGPVTVTHPDVIRYFMTIPEACQLVLQAGAMGKGGEIFLLDMGTPIKIDDLARDLISFYGLVPDIDIKVIYTGLRPGEKLYEELITEGEEVMPTRHKKIMILRGRACNQNMLNGNIDELERYACEQNAEKIRDKLKEVVPEFKNGNYENQECPESIHFEPLAADIDWIQQKIPSSVN